MIREWKRKGGTIMVYDFTKKQEVEKQEMSIKKEEEIAILSKNPKGWTIELNKISYNGREPVFDLRSWSPEGRMGKGITLTDQVLDNLLVVLKAYLEGDLPVEEVKPKEENQKEELPGLLPVDMER